MKQRVCSNEFIQFLLVLNSSVHLASIYFLFNCMLIKLIFNKEVSQSVYTYRNRLNKINEINMYFFKDRSCISLGFFPKTFSLWNMQTAIFCISFKNLSLYHCKVTQIRLWHYLRGRTLSLQLNSNSQVTRFNFGNPGRIWVFVCCDQFSFSCDPVIKPYYRLYQKLSTSFLAI